MEQGGMQKLAKATSGIMARVAILGISTQILLGFFWILMNFSSFQELGESYFFLEIQKDLVCDEYVGILYPLIMRMVTGVANVFPFPAHCLLYVLQLTVAVFAARFFWSRFSKYGQWPLYLKVCLILGMVTFPVAEQCHLAVLPISLTASLYLISVGLLIQKSDRPGVTLTKLGLLWLAETLLMPEYYLFGGILMVIFVIREFPKAFYVLLLAAVFCAGIPILSGWTSREGALGRMRQTPEAVAMRRLAWNSYGDFYPDWPAELREALTQDDIAEINAYPEQALWVLGRAVDARYEEEKVREIYGSVAKAAQRLRRSENFKDVLKDVLCYGAVPVSRLMLMAGKGNHATLEKMNYEAMRANAPKLTSLYVRYDGVCFLCLLCIFCFWQMKKLIKGNGGERKKLIQSMVTFAIMIGVIILWYALQAGGCMDEKRSLPVTALWMAWFYKVVVDLFDNEKLEAENEK